MGTDRIGPVLAWLDKHDARSLERVLDWLRIPSISTKPKHREDVRRAAQWASDRLTEVGFASRLVESGTPDKPGHPVVLAHNAPAGDYTGPHVLFYGHYDVQPAEPLDLWRSPPFEPVIDEPGSPAARIVARGACDDKGQVMTFLESLRAWHETTSEPGGGVKFTVLLEGEEESGSPNLETFLEDHADELNLCDVCLVSDTGMLSRDRPAITYGVRGLVYTEVTLHGPDQDLHSGMWGGRVPNPNNELVRILGKLWDGHRRVVVPGFYDEVRPVEPAERYAWAALGQDTGEMLAKIGLPPESDVGEEGYTALEREWARPTAEINGIYGGYTDIGAKTVIPTHSTAKVSFRLVADQNPDTIRKAFFTWLEAQTPPGCRWEFHDHGGGWPVTCATDSPVLQAARRAARSVWDVDAALIKSGGSIPVAGMLKSRLGMDTVFLGFGLDDDRVHSPNEKFELSCFRRGARTHAHLIDELRRLSMPR